MSFLNLALTKQNEPLKSFDLVFEIEGVANVYSSSVLVDFIRIGDPGLFIDGTWVIGGARRIENQSDVPLLSLDDSTTTIASSVEPDEAKGTSVEFIKIGLIDKDGEVTRLITPGEEVTDILGLDCKVWIGFQDTIFTQDYLPIFRGLITEVRSSSGIIYFSLSSGEEKKRQKMIFEFETELDGAINSSVTTFNVASTQDYLLPITGPDGSTDSSFSSFIQIEDEIMEVSSKTATSFTVVRGAQSTVAATHADESTVEGLYIVEGNPMDLALKFMLSRGDGFYIEDLEISKVGVLSDSTLDSTVLLFIDRNLILEENIRVGDFVTVTDSTLGNDVSLKEITQVIEASAGTEVYLSGVGFVSEVETGVKASFRSKYDVFPTDLGLTNDDVDIEKHEFYRSTFFPSTTFKFYIRDEIEGKSWLDDEIYKPSAVYSLSKNGRASVGYHFPPLPTANIQILDQRVIKNAEELSIQRSINRNFYNTIVYKYQDSISDDELIRTSVNIDATSVTRIPIGPRALNIESRGMKDELNGASFATQQAERRLNRYKFGAEEIQDVEVFISRTLQFSLGDTVLLDGFNLNLSDSSNGTRSFDARLMEVTERRINILNGSSSVTLIDTGFGLDNRFFLMSPVSPIKVIGSGGGTFRNYIVFTNTIGQPLEWTKWFKYRDFGFKIRIRGDGIIEDESIQEILTVQTVLETGQMLTVEEITSTNSGSKIVELAPYSDQTSEAVEAMKKVFGWMSDTTFPDGGIQYQMI